MAEKQSLGALVSGISEDISTLLRGEVELVKSEIKESARSAGKGSGLLVGAGVLGFLATIFLLLTFAWVLVQLGLPTWAGFGIVTLVLLIVTAILGFLGKKQLESVKGPERSPLSIAKTKAVLTRSAPPLDPAATPTPSAATAPAPSKPSAPSSSVPTAPPSAGASARPAAARVSNPQ
jgi:hypothetical protein